MSQLSVLLLSCYELGHQPLSLAWPLARLREIGIDARGIDLAVETFPHQLAAEATFVGVAVPMHTALRLGVQAARQVRRTNPGVHICFYGLYAWLNADYLFAEEDGMRLADTVLAGEYEQPLVALVAALRQGRCYEALEGVSSPPGRRPASLGRQVYPLPQRSSLPPLTEYARYVDAGTHNLAGYTETSRGCLHLCRHCPVVPVYQGRFFVVPVAAVMADIRQQVDAGARHITFGDPDFLNGPGHALRIAKALHEAYSGITFDFTTKVEHLIAHRQLIPQLRAQGAAFVISAFESTSENVLRQLQKGHTIADMEAALAITAAAGLPIQPTWVSFTPWTTLTDYLAQLEWIRANRIIAHVPVVQLAVRLLIPPGSALLNENRAAPWLGMLEPEQFSYRWIHSDPRMDRLHKQVAAVAEHAPADPFAAFRLVEQAAYAIADRPVPPAFAPADPQLAPPRLTEDWFC